MGWMNSDEKSVYSDEAGSISANAFLHAKFTVHCRLLGFTSPLAPLGSDQIGDPPRCASLRPMYSQVGHGRVDF